MIRLIDAEKVYENGTHALKGVSFTVEDGEFAFLVGPSGSGKSTIIKLLTGEIVPTAGRVMVNGFSMSRTSFFNKLKALTGYAPADYIRMIRLQHAAKLLKQGEYTITEIADMIGFSDAKYFREVFKKYYNVSPSQFNKNPEN